MLSYQLAFYCSMSYIEGMYIATVPNRSSPPAILLRESFREGAHVRSRTLANITHWPPERIEALRRTLRGDFDLACGGGEVVDAVFGVLFVLARIAERLGLPRALGRSRIAKLALFLVLARVAHHGSRLSAVRWSAHHAVEAVLGLAPFDEDELYEALAWIAEQQERIEARLYASYVKRVGAPPVLVLYDVTSSYFEGQCNELGAYGYNRDGKRGKKQVVIGLLTAPDGEPLAVRVFRGNTSDPLTVAFQIEVVRQRFGISEVVFVGDRGMVKSRGKQALSEAGLRYITALTDPQVRALLTAGVMQMGLFEEVVAEVEHEGRRLVLRRNEEVREKEARRVADKLARLAGTVEARNNLVASSRRAQPEKGLAQLREWVTRHRLHAFVTLSLEGRRVVCTINEAAQHDAMLLDGCYVVETDVPKAMMDAATVDGSYRNLSRVEADFRTAKTDLLEVRPIFLRKEMRTRGHVFVTMLALKIVRECRRGLTQAFGTTDEDRYAMTLDDALASLSRWCFLRQQVNDTAILRLPAPDDEMLGIFHALGVTPPRTNPRKNVGRTQRPKN